VHKFNIGQTVFLERSLSVPGGACVVTKRLPEGDGEFEYRIKSINEPARACVARKPIGKGCVVTRGVNWTRISRRNRMRRQGVEDVKGKTPLVPDQPPKQHRRRLSKAELREQAEAAFLAWREARTANDK
jgi:hypothetical protein